MLMGSDSQQAIDLRRREPADGPVVGPYWSPSASRAAMRSAVGSALPRGTRR